MPTLNLDDVLNEAFQSESDAAIEQPKPPIRSDLKLDDVLNEAFQPSAAPPVQTPPPVAPPTGIPPSQGAAALRPAYRPETYERGLLAAKRGLNKARGRDPDAFIPDVEKLDALAALPKYKEAGIAERTAAGLATGTLQAPKSAGILTRVVGDVGEKVRNFAANLGRWNPMARMLGVSHLRQYDPNLLQQVGQTASDHYGKILDDIAKTYPQGDITKNPRLLADPKWLAQGVGQALTSMSTGVITGGGSALGGAVVGSGLEALPDYETMRQEGVPLGEATVRAGLFGVAVAALNKIGLDKIFKGDPLSVKNVLASAVTEGLTESAEEPVGAITKYAAREGVGLTEFGQKVLESLRSGINVFPSAALSGGGFKAAGGVAEQRAQEALAQPPVTTPETPPIVAPEAPTTTQVAEPAVTTQPETPTPPVATESVVQPQPISTKPTAQAAPEQAPSAPKVVREQKQEGATTPSPAPAVLPSGNIAETVPPDLTTVSPDRTISPEASTGRPASPPSETTTNVPTAADIDGAVNRRKRDDLMLEKGQYHAPGLRLSDQETAGAMAYLVERGDATMQEWNEWVDRAKRENRFSDPDTPIRPPLSEKPVASPAQKSKTVSPKPKPMLRLTGSMRAGSSVAGQKAASSLGQRIAILRGLNNATNAYPGETFDRIDPSQIDEVRDYMIELQRTPPPSQPTPSEPTGITVGQKVRYGHPEPNKRVSVAVVGEDKGEGYYDLHDEKGKVLVRNARVEDFTPLKTLPKKAKAKEIKPKVTQEAKLIQRAEEKKAAVQEQKKALQPVASETPQKKKLVKKAAEAEKGKEEAAKPEPKKLEKAPTVEEARKPAAPVKVTTDAQGDKTISVPSKDKEGLPPKEQKKYLLAELDRAIAEAPFPGEESKASKKTVTIEVPGDGTFTLINERSVLNEFKKKANSKFPIKTLEPTTTIRTPKQDILQVGARAAVSIYGGERKAVEVLKRQLDSEALSEDPEMQERTGRIISSLENGHYATMTTGMKGKPKEYIFSGDDAELFGPILNKKVQESRRTGLGTMTPTQLRVTEGDLQKLAKDGYFVVIQRESGASDVNENNRVLGDLVRSDLKSKLEPKSKPPESMAGRGVGAAGAVTTSEYDPERISNKTGTTMAYLDTLRERRGLPPRTPTERKSDEQLAAQVDQIVTDNSHAGLELLAELEAMKDEVRSIEDFEEVLLKRELVIAENLANDAASVDASLAGKTDAESNAKRAANNVRMEAASNRLDSLADVAARAGTAWGRSGRARQLMMDDQFNLVRMRARRRIINDGKLSKDQEKETAELSKEGQDILDEINKRLDTMPEGARKTAEIEQLRKMLESVRKRWVAILDREKHDTEKWMKALDAYLAERKATIPDNIRRKVQQEFESAMREADEAKRNTSIAIAIGLVNEHVPLRAGDWFDAYIYSNMLSNPLSHVRNMLGNFTNALVARPLSLLGRGDIAGAVRYTARAWRSVLSGDPYRAAAKAYKKGEVGKFFEGLDSADVSKFEENKRIEGPRNRLGRALWNEETMVGRFMLAQDVMVSNIIEAAEMTRLLQRGVKPDVAQERAKALANRYLYRDKLTSQPDKSLDIVSQGLEHAGAWLDRGRRIPRLGRGMKMAIPFLKTPVKIAQFNVEMTAMGYFGAMRNRIAKAHYGMSYDQMQREYKSEKLKPANDQNTVKIAQLERQMDEVNETHAERMGKANVGTALTLLGIAAAIAGNTTWEPPKDPEAKKLFYDAGYRPYSARIGNRWIPMVYFGPGALAFSFPAAIKHILRDRPDTAVASAVEKMTRVMLAPFQMMFAQIPLEGVSAIAKMASAQEDYTMRNAIGRTISQVIPKSGFLRWVRNMVDPTMRKATTVGETVEAGIPGLSEHVKAVKDSEGMDVKTPLLTAFAAPYKVGKHDPLKAQEYKERMDLLRSRAAERANKGSDESTSTSAIEDIKRRALQQRR